MDIFDRTKLLIGEEKFARLNNCHVAVFGVGGVGGYVAEFLARAGVGTLTLVDFDKVDITNINRQIIADTTTVGRLKVDVLKDRLLRINQNIKINAFATKYDITTRDELITDQYDMIVDAIDMVTSKIDLIVTAKNIGIPIVSSMGVGNKCSIPNFVVTDIYKTSNDGLAKVLRKKLRENNIAHHTVVYSSQGVDLKGSDTIGSISYFPPACASVLVGYVINEIMNGEDKNGRNT